MADEARFEYQEAYLKDVMRAYVKDYTSEEFEILSFSEYFIDPVKEKVIFKLVVRDKPKEGE